MEKNIKLPNQDPFEEYQREADPSKRERSYAWHTAIGLQAVDGLKTSDYLKETAVKNIEGEITLSEAQALIESYYKTERKREVPHTEEADKVSSRITGILAEKGFTFSVAQYLSIHYRLFEGIYKHAGAIRDYGFGKLVGTTTYGKGVVQRIYRLGDGSALKLTVESYFTPSGFDLNGVGLSPDVEIEFDSDAYEKDKTDNQRDEAARVLRQLMKK